LEKENRAYPEKNYLTLAIPYEYVMPCPGWGYSLWYTRLSELVRHEVLFVLELANILVPALIHGTGEVEE